MKGNAMVTIGGVALAMGFCIFFGVSLATQGTERINGPLVRTQAAVPTPRTYTAAPAGKTSPLPPVPAAAAVAKAKGADRPLPRPAEEGAADTGINRLGNKTGELLQIATRHGIRWFVSMVEAVLE
ncbi:MULTISPECIES: hypothetical protein [Paenibacillus]|uniref:hypothetical protein n=1 Tax=Paenibacillus TaxID=44249 RepID=UPI0022B8E3A5|nr:hypothetical protein [Paenibacillus caseinilyticus]MCZ8518689.1 hypothetical protein [Paenibacillus caseinilyticus]